MKIVIIIVKDDYKLINDLFISPIGVLFKNPNMLHNIIVYIDVDIESKYDILLLKQKEMEKILDNLNINDKLDGLLDFLNVLYN